MAVVGGEPRGPGSSSTRCGGDLPRGARGLDETAVHRLESAARHIVSVRVPYGKVLSRHAEQGVGTNVA